VLRASLSRAAFSLGQKEQKGQKGRAAQVMAKAGTKTKAEAKAKAVQESQAASKVSPRSVSLPRLWAGLLTAPLAFLLSLQVNYTLTQKLCPAGGRMFILHLMTVLFLLGAAGGGFIAWRNWERAGLIWPGEAANKTVRNRFLAAIGILISVLCSLIIVAQLIPQFIFSPCQR
jgi:hypothetical protein